MFGDSMKIKELLLDKSLLFYTIIGISNTLFCMCMEYLMNNVIFRNIELSDTLHYWLSTGIPFAITSVTSFVFNRKFSFKSEGNLFVDAVKFYVLFALCYVVAFFVAKPLAVSIISAADPSNTHITNISIIVGQCVFTPLNYFGQRFLVYRKKKQPLPEETETAEPSDIEE